jgi:hypothetical protein
VQLLVKEGARIFEDNAVSIPPFSSFPGSASAHLSALQGLPSPPAPIFSSEPLPAILFGCNRHYLAGLLRVFSVDQLLPLEKSALASPGGRMMSNDDETDSWEIDRNELVMHEILG